ncbi:acetyl-CoA acetyltransferase [Ilumatobacter sp.]|uniref:acetyl-CoA acetyltransferase n=1 Tax=Ilumatobacter sp. TaxID=1967498 RepID=UPI003B522B7B
MDLDPRTPVVVGVGQYLHRADSLDDALEPAALMERAVREAASDAGLDGPPAADSVRVVNIIGWRYRNAARFLAGRLGIEGAELAESAPGGNSPQMLVNRTALDIAAGSTDVAVLAGGEAFRTYMRARKEDVTLDWPKADDDDDPVIIGEELVMNHPHERELGIWQPVQIYPMFETALRAADGRDVVEHEERLGRLWSDLSHVAAGNPNAWIRDARSPQEITTVTAGNRMIGLPYPKLMNSNSDVDMAASVIMCSVEAARRLGIDEDRWVFPLAGTDCHEHDFVSNRDTFSRTPAIELGGSRALSLAGLDIDDVALIDLYSCFPSAVQLGARSLGIDPFERQWSRTGGLPFCGGPWNDYPMHAIATIVTELRERRGEVGLVWANGGYATKHSFGLYSTNPPSGGFRHESPQDEIDALPKRELAIGAEAAGDVHVEAYTVMFSRDGDPETALTACRTDDGRRAWGRSSDPGTAAAMCDGEWVGIGVRLDDDATLHV